METCNFLLIRILIFKAVTVYNPSLEVNIYFSDREHVLILIGGEMENLELNENGDRLFAF